MVLVWCCFLLVCGAAFSSVLLGVAAHSTSLLSVLPAFSLLPVGGAALPFSSSWVVEYIVFFTTSEFRGQTALCSVHLGQSK